MISLWPARLPSQHPGPVMPMIAEQVAAKYGVSVSDLKGKCRAREIVIPRQEAFWRCRQVPHLSLPQIGRFFNRDHSTVLHGVRRHENRRTSV